MSIIDTLPYTLTNGQTADASQVMADFNTIVNGVNDASTGAASIPGVQQNSYNFAADSGGVNAIIIGMTPSPVSYTDGLRGYTKAANTNTSTTVTVKFGSLGTKSVVLDQAGTLPYIGSIISGMHYVFEYDSTQDKCILINPSTATGTFTVTATGFSTTVNGTARWTIANGMVYLTLPILSGTSNAPTLTLTNIPSAIQPTTTQDCTVLAKDAGSIAPANITPSASSTWNAYTNLANSWTSSGTKGWNSNAFTIVYRLF